MEFQKMIEVYHLGRNILLHGPAGTGKTKCIRDFVRTLDDVENVNYQILAPTGTAACNIQGMTIQSYFQLSAVDDKMPRYQKIKTQINTSKYVADNIDLLIIDEISMVGDELIEIMDQILKKFYNRSKPFGGVRCIVSGDFCQLSPVKQKWCFETKIWAKMSFYMIPFENQKRYSCDQTFEMLNRLRSGRLSQLDKKWFKERMDAYKRGDHKLLPIQPIELYASVKEVERINDENMSRIDSPAITFEAVDEYPPGFANANKYLSDLANKYCTLKVGIPIIFYRNYNIQEGLTNGTSGKILDIVEDEKKIMVELANGEIYEIYPKRYTIMGAKWKISRTQLPIMPGWAMTQAKSQGSTLTHAIVSLKCHHAGQFYTTVSRVIDFNNVYIKNVDYKSIKMSKEVDEWLQGLGV